VKIIKFSGVLCTTVVHNDVHTSEQLSTLHVDFVLSLVFFGVS